MRKITLSAILVLISTFSFAATGWFSDFLTISVNGTSAPNNYYIGTDPATGATALQAKAFGLVTSLELSGVDMMYWSDVQDRTGSAVYYKITNSSNTFEFVPATEIILDHTFILGNNYQGTKSLSVNLLAGLPSGAYQLHVWAKSWSGAGGEGDSWLSNNSANYVATFMKAPASTTPMSGTYKVGNVGTADFNSLSAAVNAVNTYGVGGNVLFEIDTDLSESNVGLGVNTSSYSITFKPAATKTPTITFTDGTTSQNIDGHFVIGSPTFANTNLISTNNIVIDGSNTVGGNTKDLTINGPVTVNQRSVFRIFGNNDNITIKNCIITCKSTSGNTTSPVLITNYNGSSTNYTPDNISIVNNTLTGGLANGGSGISVSNSGTPTAYMTGIRVQNNIISARATRAIMFNYTGDGEISGNIITHDCQLGTGAAQTIYLTTAGATAGTFNIFNNKITLAKTWNTVAGASNGIVGIDNTVTTPKVVNIYNNFVTGFSTVATTTNSKIYGIRCTSTSTSNVYHNTIVIPEMTNMTAFGSSYIAGIAFATAATTEASPTGIINIKNNIIISNESTMKVWAIRRIGTGGTFTSDNNVIYAATANNLAGYYNATDATLLSDWQSASGQDAASKSANVNFVDAATGDLRIAATSYQDANLQVVRLTDVPKDLFGTDRDYYTYAGAHQAEKFLINSNENPAETSARIMRTMSGIEVQLNREANIELYTINGMLIDKARINGTYTRNLNAGIYIIRIDGIATKFVK